LNAAVAGAGRAAVAAGGAGAPERPQAPERNVFDVKCSLTGRAWYRRAFDERAARAIAERHDLPYLIGRILAGRGIEPADVPGFLDPTVREAMPDPSVLADMDPAARRIAGAILAAEPIAVLADYDVDGAASAALIARYLRALGRDCAVHVPDRVREGYGPTAEALTRLVDEGARLIITVDCGIQGGPAFAAIAGRADVVVIDHHQAGEALPEVAAVVNPNRHDDLSGLGHLAAAGVVFMTLVAVSRELRRCGGLARGGEPDLLGLLPLVALATVCDVVPLTGLNRALVAQGLRLTARRDIPGLVALADAARMSGPPSVYHLGFVLGPRINAGGRIGRSELGYRLLASVEVAEVEQLAGELERLNAERQAIEQAALVEAGEMVEAGGGRGGVIVVASERWHPGIVGLVAARLVERYRRPAIAIAVGADGTSRGSGRSVPGVDLGAAVRAAADAGIILRGGGHAMAAGLTVGAGGIEALAGFVNDALGDVLDARPAEVRLSIDAPLSAAGASRELMALIERAGPFGMGHPEPVFAFAAHRVSFAKTVGHGHVRVNLAAEDGSRLDGVAFRAAGTALGDALAAPGRSALHVAGRLKASAWQGRERIELVIEDAARPR